MLNLMAITIPFIVLLPFTRKAICLYYVFIVKLKITKRSSRDNIFRLFFLKIDKYLINGKIKIGKIPSAASGLK